ncbi:hypothetical protein OUHCRE5_51580 [Enterobacter asburiae]
MAIVFLRPLGLRLVDFCCEQCYDNYTRKYMDKVYDHLSNGKSDRSHGVL